MAEMRTEPGKLQLSTFQLFWPARPCCSDPILSASASLGQAEQRSELRPRCRSALSITADVQYCVFHRALTN